MFKAKIIRAPKPATLDMIKRRMPAAIRQEMEGKSFDAIGLIQTDLPSLFYLADVGQKAAAVTAVELTGTCPQHITTVAFLGDTAAVSSAIRASKAASEEKDKF